MARKQDNEGTRTRSEMPASLPPAAREAMLASVDSVFEHLGHDGGSVMKNDRPFARSPMRFAKRTVGDLVERTGFKPWRAALEQATEPLADWLRGHPIDDIDEAVEAICAAAGLRFDVPKRELDAKLRVELARVLEKTAASAGTKDVDPATFATAAITAARKCLASRASDDAGAWEWVAATIEANLSEGKHLLCTDPKDTADKLVSVIERAQNLVWRTKSGRAEAYDPSRAYRVGERVAHPKFGEGEVVELFDGKVEIDFGGTRRRLACGRLRH
jgi:hypothetical protein